MTHQSGPLDERFWRDFAWGMVWLAAVGVALRALIALLEWWL